MGRKVQGIIYLPDVFDDPDVTGAALLDYRKNPPTLLGYTIGIPQTCRKGRNPTPSTSWYGTEEWMREVLFSDDPDTVSKAKRDYPDSRLKTGSEALGCGAVSAQVRVTKIASDGHGGYREEILLPDNGFFAVIGSVLSSVPNPGGNYTATEIWINDRPWPADDPQVVKMMQFVDNLHLPPHCL